MNSTSEIAEHLLRHLGLSQEILTMVEREKQTLRDSAKGLEFETYQAKKNLLPRLDQSLNQIRQHRIAWQKLNPAQRAQHPDVTGLLRQNQDVIMKIIIIDRENEQMLLRNGLMPARHLPSANRQRPHHVADMYRRQSRSEAGQGR